VASLARSMGVRQSKLNEVPSLALGTSPVTLKEMVTSFSTIANGGNYIEPTMVTAMEDRDAQGAGEPSARRPSGHVEPGGADAAGRDARRDRQRHRGGPAPALRLTGDLAGKTGTTQDNTDGWFILMHPQPGGGRLDRLQRQPRDHAQQLLGAGRAHRAVRGGRLHAAGAEPPQEGQPGEVPAGVGMAGASPAVEGGAPRWQPAPVIKYVTIQVPAESTPPAMQGGDSGGTPGVVLQPPTPVPVEKLQVFPGVVVGAPIAPR
jgi:penicillin-binding protein 1A